MKKTFVISVAAMCGVLSLCGCQQDVVSVEEQQAEPTSVLHVFTRSGDDPAVAADVPSPVSLYVFNSGGKCVRMLADVTQNALVPVAGGTYGVYAIAGADAARYELPTADDATKTSIISLKENQTVGELMTTHSLVSVADATEHNLTLTLTRAVAAIRQITIKQVPSAVTAVSVTIAPLYEAMAIDGSYSGTGGSCSATLTEEADGKTWSFAGGNDGPFFLPSVGKPTVTVTFTTADGNTAYSYSAAEELAANRKLSIEGTYTEQAKLKITGTITGTEWGEDQTITFEFDENSSSAATPSSGEGTGGGSGTGGGTGGSTGGETGGGETSQTVTLPAVGDMYKGTYYVLSVDEANNQIVLLSPEIKETGLTTGKTEAAALATLQSMLDTWEENPVGVWRIPTVEETRTMASKKLQIKPHYNNFGVGSNKICCMNNGNLDVVIEGLESSNPMGYAQIASSKLRPVATVTVTGSN